ncbi:WD40 repeat-like protein [Testicularia cyperi]|uniref:ASTRA-associated protein 1 n=1 Tax=Testicularia cyperi TaxID=1882483 RepID=A0A317XQW5_9BASI|nr:WD40 repeat-like protein [Testicularia cyperi]
MKPFWVLRHHASASVRCLHYDHGMLAVGDEQGQVSLVDLKTLRPRFSWKAHTDGLLTVIVLSSSRVLTHGRDNNLHVWTLPDLSDVDGTQDGQQAEPAPSLVKTIGVNALNFASCSYRDGLIAVPNALDAAYIDILDLDSGIRTHEAISRPDIVRSSGQRLPIAMSLHLLQQSVLAGYEDGWVRRWSLDGQLLWESRCHSESVMSTAICSTFGVSVGADDRIAKFDIKTGKTTIKETTAAGKATVAIAPNGQTCCVGGWDGSIRVYACEDLREIGRLEYHRNTVDALQFCPPVSLEGHSTDSDSDDSSNGHTGPPNRTRQTPSRLTLAAGGRDGKISLWNFY